MATINTNVPRPEDKLLQQFQRIAPSDYGHSLNFDLIPARILRPLFPIEAVFAGPALTVRIPPNDSFMVYKALELLQPGDVLVIDMNQEERYACWGEITTRIALKKGAVAAVVNGAVTDTIVIKELKFPVYSYSVSPLTTKLYNIDGDINVPVSISGCVVSPGDIIVGNNDGLLVVPQQEVWKILEIGKREEAADDERRKALKQLGVDEYLKKINRT